MAAVLAARMPSAVVARRSTGPNNAPGTMRASSRVNNGSNNNSNSNSATRRRMTTTLQQRSGVIGSHRRRVGGATAPAAARGPIVNFLNVFGGSTKEKEKQEMKDGEEDDGETTTEKITTAEEEKKSVSYDLLDLKNGAEGSVQAAADVFERVDDVVMGGVSSSAIGPDLAGRDCLVWAGKCRVQGGGFTGARTVALKTPLDLSAFDGVAMSCGFESDDEPQRRTWKATLRTQNNRGEVVYQATFVPPVSSSDSNEKPAEVRIPWESFRLVRGPVVVPDVPPLSADQCKEVYGLGLIMSRFGPQGPMPEFREGPFRLALHALGVYAADTAAAAAAAKLSPPQTLPAAVADNAGKKSSENRGSRNAMTFVLAPIIALVFSEKGRRRKRARALLKERFGMGEFKARFGYGQGLKATRKGSGAAAAAEGVAELARDAVAAVLTLPLRGLFVLVSKLARVVRRLKGQKPLPKMK